MKRYGVQIEPCATFDPCQVPEERNTVCFTCGWNRADHKLNEAITETYCRIAEAESIDELCELVHFYEMILMPPEPRWQPSLHCECGHCWDCACKDNPMDV